MATPADQRLLELLDKWLKSLELHSQYSSLDDDSYWKVQPWVEHQRPARWILDLARQKTLALKAQVEERVRNGDAKFSDSLELMIFLANLVGSEHIERFIPVAEPGNERSLKPAEEEAPAVTDTQEIPQLKAEAGKSEGAVTATREMPLFSGERKSPGESSITATREMPKFPGARPVPAPPPIATPHVVRNERKAPAGKPASKEADRSPAASAPESDDPREQVVADAVRLVQWGRKWYELAELIARMADRPTLPEVRRILKDNKAAIEKKAGSG